MKIIKISFLFLIVILSLSFVSSVNAEESRMKTFRMSDVESSRSAKERGMMIKDNPSGTPGAKKLQKLSESRIRVCETRSENISKRIKNFLTVSEKHHLKLDNIVKRVDEFYLEKLQPKGYALNNYVALKEDIANKQGNLNDALEQAQTDGQNFSCDSEDPKSQADTFRRDMLNVISANKEYKKSVRAFVAAVRDLAKKEFKGQLTPIVSPIPDEEVNQ